MHALLATNNLFKRFEGVIATDRVSLSVNEREVHALFKQQLSPLRQRLDDVLSKDVNSFNKLLIENNVKTVIKVSL